MPDTSTTDTVIDTTVGDVMAAFLEEAGCTEVFGVISIHNMPLLDGIHRRGRIRYVMARGEAGAVNMADAAARVSGRLTVAFTSTGTACGNAAGAMVEALTAGTPFLHVTGQIDSPFVDKGRSFIHEAPDQPGLIKAVSKKAFRVWSAETALGVLREAVRCAFTAPTGPVTIEIPVDIQRALARLPADLRPSPLPVMSPDEAALDALAEAVAGARRPLLWLGGGARHASAAVKALVEMGIGVVTSTQGRGVIPEDHPMTLGAYNMSPEVEAFYKTCDLMLVAGSRLRGNETKTWKLALPRPLWQIDADASADGRAYPTDGFLHADAALALQGLAERLAQRPPAIDPAFAADLAAARAGAKGRLWQSLGPYAQLVEQLQSLMPRDGLWVRDVTISNSTWGNRALPLHGPRDGVHALGGGIGQGLPMGIGAAIAMGAAGRKTVVLSGDGALALCMGELLTAAQENADLVLLIMNDRGYGVIRNIQDAQYGARRAYADPIPPDFALLGQAVGIPHVLVRDLVDFPAAMAAALQRSGPAMVEIDMTAIGPFSVPFAGPPVPGAKH